MRRKVPLIFDLGMNDGTDAAYYLSCGFNVVAVEANPELCEQARKRFGNQITIIEAAITDRNGKADFYISENDHLSSLLPERAKSNHKITVNCITIDDLFKRFGVPYYLKIDIEGADLAVIAMLDRRPKYLSVEDCRFGPKYIEKLAALGYEFQLIDQSQFKRGFSGPFGDYLPDAWLPHDVMLQQYYRVVRNKDGQRIAPQTQWFDIHCKSTAC